MKRSIAVVVAGRGLTILWVFATVQIMCQPLVDEDSAEVYKTISENKADMVTQMITDRGLEKASRRLHMSPLIAADMNPTTDDDDDDATTAPATEEQKQHHRRRPRPYVTPEVDNTGTGIYGERQAEMSQTKNDLPVNGNVETPFTNYDGQEFENYPHPSKLVSESPKSRRAKSRKKNSADSKSMDMFQV